jgi:predicted RecA/RadA family phage recombinase
MALTANTIRPLGWGNVTQYPVKASQTIYEGSAVGITAGYARALTSGDIFVGFAAGKVIEATAGDGGAVVQVYKAGIADLTITSVAVTDVGKPVYASDDGTFSLTQGSSSLIGTVQKYVTTNTASVEFKAYPAGAVANKIYGTLTFPITNAKIADGDILVTYTPGFAGTIEKWAYVTHDPVPTGSKASTLNLEIGTVDVTGGALALTSATMTPIGKVIAAAAITAANVFTSTSTISVDASATTTFIEGTGSIVITYSQALPA